MSTQIFPPKEVAMELKRVGFNEPCVGWYSSNIHYPDSTTPHIEGSMQYNAKINNENSCTAPTYDQVIGWFAEVHGIEILLASKWHGYQYEIIVKGDDELVPNKIVNYETRQQSLLTAFREAIKLIEK